MPVPWRIAFESDTCVRSENNYFQNRAWRKRPFLQELPCFRRYLLGTSPRRGQPYVACFTTR
jgi:hypothetical protein